MCSAACTPLVRPAAVSRTLPAATLRYFSGPASQQPPVHTYINAHVHIRLCVRADASFASLNIDSYKRSETLGLLGIYV